MHLGLSSYTYPWAVGVPGYWPDQPLTPLDLLERTREAGLRYLQIGDNLPLHTQTAAVLEALHGEARAAGVGIQVGTRRLEVVHLRRYLALAERFGSPFLRVVIDDADYHPDVATVVPIIQAVLPDFRAAGVVLAIENHDRFPARTLARIIEQTDPEWVGICLDTANSIGAGEGADTVVEVLAPYTVNLHLKDVRIERLPHKMGFTVSGCAAGEGLIPIPELIRHLDTTGRCATATLEIWSNPEPTALDCIQKEAILADRSINYLRSLFT